MPSIVLIEAGGKNNGSFNLDTTGLIPNSSGYSRLHAEPSDYGKWAKSLDTSGIGAEEAIRSIDAYVHQGEASAAFKNCSRQNPVINIDDLQGMAPEQITGAPAVFKVWSAQVNGLDVWDIDTALRIGSGKNVSGAMCDALRSRDGTPGRTIFGLNAGRS